MQKEQLHINKRSRGFVLIDALVSAGILLVIVGAFVSGIISSQRAAFVAGDKNRALFLAEEGLEAARNIRDANYSNLVDGTYGIQTTGNQYGLSGSQDTSDIFTRTVQVKTVDPVTKQIISTVAWNKYGARSVTVTTDLVNPTLLGMAGLVTVDVSAAVRTGILNLAVTGIMVTNNGSSPVVISSISIGGLINVGTVTIAPGSTANLGTLSLPLLSGLLPTVITFTDQTTKALNLSL
ncbi:MAG: hypothetical protein V4665_01600 [Patescibacteria group bacterium]